MHERSLLIGRGLAPFHSSLGARHAPFGRPTGRRQRRPVLARGPLVTGSGACPGMGGCVPIDSRCTTLATCPDLGRMPSGPLASANPIRSPSTGVIRPSPGPQSGATRRRRRTSLDCDRRCSAIVRHTRPVRAGDIPDSNRRTLTHNGEQHTVWHGTWTLADKASSVRLPLARRAGSFTSTEKT